MKPSELNRKTRAGSFKIANIHQWIIYHFGKANKCENKDCKKIGKRFEYALINNKTYERKIENYIMLCSQCHRKYDWDNGQFQKQKSIFREAGVKNGSKNGKVMCKFTMAEANKIRKEYNLGAKQRELARKYKVSQSLISLMVKNKTYKI